MLTLVIRAPGSVVYHEVVTAKDAQAWRALMPSDVNVELVDDRGAHLVAAPVADMAGDQ